MNALLFLFSRFRHDRRGNIAVIFAIACLPLISAVGCAVDYARATQLKSKLQAAADAAAVGSLSKTSPAFIAAGSMTADGPIAVGVADAANIFNANVSGLLGYTMNTLSPNVQKTGSTVTSTVSFNASVPAVFLGVIGMHSMTVTGTSQATSNMPQFIDFYLLLDNSPSMGVGATPADVSTMVNNTPDQCAFACHDTTDSNSYYNLAKTLGVTMRIDVLRQATQQLMDTATNTSTYANQFRMGLYDFGTSASSAGLNKVYDPPTGSLSLVKSAAGTIDLMAVAGQNQNSDMDTDFDGVLTAMNALIPNPGTGASGSPLKYLFFVSDGVADESNTSCMKPLNGSVRCQEPINTALCDAIKARGIKIAVLYTTYLALPTNAWYMTWVSPFNAGPYGPSPNSQIAQNMQSCASSGLYFEVSPTQGISSAMNALFQKAVADARISS